MPAQPLLSIVIATKNRVPYAMDAIKSILAIADADLELIIQDNSDTPELRLMISEKVDDSRLRYNYTPPPFSSIDNFNAAIAIATGEYVCVIGDDDGLNPEIMAATRWAKENDLDALKPKVCVTYLWPGVTLSSIAGVVVPGTMTVNRFSKQLRFPEIRKELDSLMRNGGQRYLETDLPRVYHGIVRRSCIEEIKQRTGNYFGGLSPDIYAVVALSTFAKRTAAIDYPLTIAGVCPASASAERSFGRHVGKLEDAPHFRDRPPYAWSDLVPRFYSAVTIWADTTTAVVRDLGRQDLLDEFDVTMLAAYCVWSHPQKQYREIALRDMYKALRLRKQSTLIGTLRFLCNIVTGPGLYFCSRVIRRLASKVLGKTSQRFTDLPTISDATEKLRSDLKSRNCTFSACVAGRSYPKALSNRSIVEDSLRPQNVA